MSFAIPNATDYISFARISDPLSLSPGWVVVAVLETQFPQTNYVNGQPVTEMAQNVDFLVALPGKREDACLVSENAELMSERNRLGSEIKFAKEAWAKEKTKLESEVHRLKESELHLAKQRDDEFEKRKTDERANVGLRAEIARLKESMASVMLLVADNQRASVASLAEAQAVGQKMGEDPCASRS